jgi:hypothetical protein
MDNNRLSQVTKVHVDERDDIDSIKKKIKDHGRPDFDTVDAFQIEAYTSMEQDEPLDSLEMWSKTVIWGTPERPLIVKIAFPYRNIRGM